MRYAAAIFLLSAISTLAQEQKPACTASNHGRFWPEEANAGAGAARQFSQRGELEMCALVMWKYQWRKLTVNVRNLPRKKSASARDAEADKPLPKVLHRRASAVVSRPSYLPTMKM